MPRNVRIIAHVRVVKVGNTFLMIAVGKRLIERGERCHRYAVLINTSLSRSDGIEVWKPWFLKLSDNDRIITPDFRAEITNTSKRG